VRRVIPLWISIPWWFAGMAIVMCWHLSGRPEQWGELGYLPIVTWALFADRMRDLEKPYPRWK
jgi:hypothetical protein